MSVHVPTHFEQKYKRNVELALQQRQSRLRVGCTMGSYTGSKSGRAVDRIEKSEAQKVTTRHADTPILNTPAAERWVFPVDYEWGDMVDDFDKLKMGIELAGGYTQTCAAALARACDQEIIDAYFGAAKTGENGGTSTAFDTTNNQIAVGATGLTLAKLKEAKRILMANEVDVEIDPIYCAITAKQHEDLLGITEVASLDYNNRPVLVDGVVTRFLGIQFLHTQKLGVDGSGDRRIPVWAKSGMHLGMWNEIDVQVFKRGDKKNNAQVYGKVSCGATRTDEKRVVEVLCSES